MPTLPLSRRRSGRERWTPDLRRPQSAFLPDAALLSGLRGRAARLRSRDSGERGRARPAPAGRPAPGRQTQEGIFCRRCHHLITLPEFSIPVNDLHRHTFANPQGIVFTIRCFEQAEGCASTGLPPTTEFTWFPGFAWRIVVCRFCRTHLGWHFAAERDADFYGLIEDRLVFIEKQPE